jgi:hypothetical protein
MAIYESMGGDKIPPKYNNMIKDSGERSVYTTGAQRDNGEDKGRPSLIVPSALRRLAIQLEAGARKYADRNWEKGMDADRYVDGIYRHLWAFMEGQTDENHLGALLFNVVGLSHTYDMVRAGQLPADLFRNLPTVSFSDILPLSKVGIDDWNNDMNRDDEEVPF